MWTPESPSRQNTVWASLVAITVLDIAPDRFVDDTPIGLKTLVTLEVGQPLEVPVVGIQAWIRSGIVPGMTHYREDPTMTMLSQRLFDVADAADAETQEAIDADDAGRAMRCLQRAAQFRRLAIHHHDMTILTSDLTDDPPLLTNLRPGISDTDS